MFSLKGSGFSCSLDGPSYIANFWSLKNLDFFSAVNFYKTVGPELDTDPHWPLNYGSGSVPPRFLNFPRFETPWTTTALVPTLQNSLFSSACHIKRQRAGRGFVVPYDLFWVDEREGDVCVWGTMNACLLCICHSTIQLKIQKPWPR